MLNCRLGTASVGPGREDSGKGRGPGAVGILEAVVTDPWFPVEGRGLDGRDSVRSAPEPVVAGRLVSVSLVMSGCWYAGRGLCL